MRHTSGDPGNSDNCQPRHASKAKRLGAAGFSLVEVVLAIGVVAFAFVPMLGLLPVGLTTFRQSIETTVGSQIVERIINQAQETDFNTLVNPSSNPYPQKLYFDDQGNQLSSPAGSVYLAEVTVVAPTTLPNTSSPASANLATVSVRFAHAPGLASFESANANSASSTVYTALIARNQ